MEVRLDTQVISIRDSIKYVRSVIQGNWLDGRGCLSGY